MINHLTDTAEHRAIAQGKGRWGDPDFPKIGWEFIGVTDKQNLTGRCEACGAAIRYVQHLTHVLEDYVLDAGCVCAGYLTEDAEQALTRHKAAARAAKAVRDTARRAEKQRVLDEASAEAHRVRDAARQEEVARMATIASDCATYTSRIQTEIDSDQAEEAYQLDPENWAALDWRRTGRLYWEATYWVHLHCRPTDDRITYVVKWSYDKATWSVRFSTVNGGWSYKKAYFGTSFAARRYVEQLLRPSLETELN